MKITKKLASLLAVVMMTSSLVYAKAVTGVAIFNHSVGARQLGMADAVVGLADDVNAIFYNPAGLATVRTLELNAMYFDNIVDTKDESISVVNPLRKGIFGRNASIGASIKAYQGGDIEVIMVDSGNNILSQRTMTAESDYIASVSYAEEVAKNINVGVTAKYIHSTLVEDYSASTMALDLGILYNTPVEGLSAGLSFLNNGGEMKFIDEGDSLPQRTIVGVGYKMSPMENVGLKLGGDYISEKDADGRSCLGLELTLKNMVMLRTGYYTNSDLGGVTAGIGVKIGMFQLDYGYGLMDELGNLQRASMTMRWDTPKATEAKKSIKKRKVVRKKRVIRKTASKSSRRVKKTSASIKKKYNISK